MGGEEGPGDWGPRSTVERADSLQHGFSGTAVCAFGLFLQQKSNSWNSDVEKADSLIGCFARLVMKGNGPGI